LSSPPFQRLASEEGGSRNGLATNARRKHEPVASHRLNAEDVERPAHVVGERGQAEFAARWRNVLGWNWLAANGGDSSRVGWIAGGGVEYAWTNNWTLGAEYLYYNLGSRTLQVLIPRNRTFQEHPGEGLRPPSFFAPEFMPLRVRV
jgi:opacity protein-like surface antigen